MAKVPMKIIVGIGLLVLLVIFLNNNGTQSISPYTGYCTNINNGQILTDIYPADTRYTGYDNTGAWISIDTNGDGVKEVYGYRVTASTGGPIPGTVIAPYFNGYDDISVSSDKKHLYIGSSESSTHVRYIRMDKDYGAANYAIPDAQYCLEGKTCNPSLNSFICINTNYQNLLSVGCIKCLPNEKWSGKLYDSSCGSCQVNVQCTIGQKVCVTDSSYKICLSNGVWGVINSCASGQTCTNGVCSTPGQNNMYCGDGSCNNGETTSSCVSDCPSNGGNNGSGQGDDEDLLDSCLVGEDGDCSVTVGTGVIALGALLAFSWLNK